MFLIRSLFIESSQSRYNEARRLASESHDRLETHDEESSFFRMRSLYSNFFGKEKREEEDSLKI
jgi:hypothetical protein